MYTDHEASHYGVNLRYIGDIRVFAGVAWSRGCVWSTTAVIGGSNCSMSPLLWSALNCDICRSNALPSSRACDSTINYLQFIVSKPLKLTVLLFFWHSIILKSLITPDNNHTVQLRSSCPKSSDSTINVTHGNQRKTCKLLAVQYRCGSLLTYLILYLVRWLVFAY